MKKLFLIAFVTLLSACSSKPSDGEAENAFRAELDGRFGSGTYVVNRFERTNGAEGPEGTYDVDAKFEVVFKKSWDDLRQDSLNKTDGSFFQTAGVGMTYNMWKMSMGEFAAGQKVASEVRLHLVKTEKGWRLKGS